MQIIMIFLKINLKKLINFILTLKFKKLNKIINMEN